MTDITLSLNSRPNRWINVAADSSVQLTYSPQVNPAPLTVSIPGQDPILASLEVVITNETEDDIAVESIDFSIVVGPGASLTPTTSGIQYIVSDTTDWSISGPSGIITEGTAVYSISPATGESVTLTAGSSVVVQIYQIQTNQTPGSTTINVKETLADSQLGFTSFQLTTFPDSFYFNSLSVATPDGSSFIPVAQVAAGTPVTLLWNASVVDTTAFTIYYSTNEGQQSGTPDKLGEWTSPNLYTDTVFTVKVVAAVVGGAPLTASLSTVVSVQNPDLLANTLTVNGASTLTGNTTASTITATGLTVNGAASAQSVTSGSLGVTGTATIATANVTSTLTVQNETVNGSFAAEGAVSVMKAAVSLAPAKTYTTKTDGIVVATVSSPSDPYNASGTITLVYQNAGVQVQASVTGLYSSDLAAFIPQSITIPVPANSSLSLSTQAGLYSPVFTAWFIPFGLSGNNAIS